MTTFLQNMQCDSVVHISETALNLGNKKKLFGTQSGKKLNGIIQDPSFHQKLGNSA
jgi:hypothetical protein